MSDDSGPARPRSLRLAVACAGLAALLGLSSACSIKKMAVNSLGNALARGGDTYASDDDPELVAAAVPFGLKTIEALLAESPTHAGLLLAASSGFTQYSFAFVQSEADYVEAHDLARATALRNRARRLYARAREYGLRGLDSAHPGFRAHLRGDSREREAALAATRREDVDLLYWTGAAWAAGISISKDDPEMTADQGIAASLMQRALDLDERFGGGSIHDFFVSYDGGRPPSAGGSVESARKHLAQAVAISQGRRAAPYVSFAETVCVGQQNRKEFEELLKKALAVDPDKETSSRLANLVAQRRARWLLTRADELFVE
jgi:predicted anti-sigma-YlaC factor YlaD